MSTIGRAYDEDDHADKTNNQDNQEDNDHNRHEYIADRMGKHVKDNVETKFVIE